MANIGIKVYEKATSVQTPKVAAVGIPFVVGTAPVNTAAKPAKVNTPVLCTSWDEAVEKLGYSEDWETYTLCEFMYSHFQLFGCQPAIFCNVLDTASMKTSVAAAEKDVAEHQITLPGSAIQSSIVVTTVAEAGDSGATATTLVADTDYTVFYSDGKCVIELISGSANYAAAKLSVAYDTVNASGVTATDIAMAVGQVDACMTAVGVVPDLICAPGWSSDSVVAATMATKASAISGIFAGKAVIDIDCSSSGVTEYSQLQAHKNTNNFVDENEIVCWPMVKLGSYKFHLSTQLCGLMASVDTDNRGIPYESPSNKNLKIDGCCLADGTEINLAWPQVQLIAGSWGIVTAVNFMDSGWVAKGNYTACYPSNTDVKDQFIPVSRMFDFIGNTLIRTFWSKLDKPLTTVLRDSLLQTCNIWLSGLSGSGYLYGAKAEMLASENPLTSLLDGVITLHVYNAPPVPMQQLDFILEYDVSYMESALS